MIQSLIRIAPSQQGNDAAWIECDERGCRLVEATDAAPASEGSTVLASLKQLPTQQAAVADSGNVLLASPAAYRELLSLSSREAVQIVR